MTVFLRAIEFWATFDTQMEVTLTIFISIALPNTK